MRQRKCQRRVHCYGLRQIALRGAGAGAVGVDLGGGGVARAGDAGAQAQFDQWVFDDAGATTVEPMMVPSGSAGAMWVTLATSALMACWKAGCGFSLSSTR